MKSDRKLLKLLALIFAFALVAAACGSDDDDAGSEETEDGTETEGGATEEADATDGSEEEEEATAAGGELVLGAEQWPECLNPITQCSNASWLTWSVLHHVLPKLMEVDPEGNFVPTPVLAGEPELAGEGIDDSGDPFTITYTIAEEAVWDDGTPITSTDIRRTLEVRMGTTGVISTQGYEVIESIDDSDPKVAVVTWTEPYADWQDVFGGGTEFFLKADALGDTDDIADLFNDTIPFSGAPFILEEWSTEELTLVANPMYWGEERTSQVDTVTMIPLEDTEAEITALLAGEVHALFPQPTPGITQELGDMEYAVGFGATFEELWLNQGSLLNPDSVLQYPEVREAMLYAIDREQLLTEVMHPDIPETEMLNCDGWVPTIGDWCDQTDFAEDTYDPELAASILEEAGWVKGDDGIYARDGVRLALTWQTVAGNQRREDTQAIVIPALQEFGIEITADNYDAGTLFEQRLPQMQTEMMMYAWVTSPDPSVTTWADCVNIATPENDFSGQNNIGWCNEAASELMRQSDVTPAVDERLDIIHQIGDLMREDVIAIPLWQLPLITAWDPAVVSGPIGEYNASPQGGFGNIYDWEVIG